MTSYDVLFWLFVLLMGGIAYSIESGIGSRHRRLVLTSLVSVLLSSMYVMFMIEDNSTLDLGPRAGPLGNGGGGGERGVFRYNNKPASGIADDPSGSGSGDGSAGDIAENYPRGGFKDCSDCPDMVVIPEGKFMNGSPDRERGREDTESPQKEIVHARPFSVGRTEITRRQFASFISATGYTPSDECTIGGERRNADWRQPGIAQTDNHPVVCVSWRDASNYATWLSEKTKRSYRLISESEWEYATRAGAKTAFWSGDELNESQANFNDIVKRTAPVGYSRPNPFGLQDVHGNVWEITQDCLTKNAGSMPGDGTPANLMGNCAQRVIKGGGWQSPWNQVRTAFRASAGERAASNQIGFRIARTLQKEDRTDLKK